MWIGQYPLLPAVLINSHNYKKMPCSIQYRIAARHLFMAQLASLTPGVDDADGDKGEDEEENSDEDGVNLRHYLH